MLSFNYFSFSNSVDTYALARNVEDLESAKYTPIIAAAPKAQSSKPSSRFSQMASALSNSMVSLIH